MTEQNIEIINEEVVTKGLLQSKAGKIVVVIGGITLGVTLLATAGNFIYKKVIKKKTNKVDNEVNETNE